MPDDVVSASTARAHFSTLLHRAREGSTFTITISGIPVGTLGPPYTGATSGTAQTQMDVVDASHPSRRKVGERLNVAATIEGDEPL